MGALSPSPLFWGALETSCWPRLRQQQPLELPWGHLVSGLTSNHLGSRLALQMSPDPAGAGGCRKTPERSFWSPNRAETPNTRGTLSPRRGCHPRPGALLQPQGILPASLGGTRRAQATVAGRGLSYQTLPKAQAASPLLPASLLRSFWEKNNFSLQAGTASTCSASTKKPPQGDRTAMARGWRVPSPCLSFPHCEMGQMLPALLPSSPVAAGTALPCPGLCCTPCSGGKPRRKKVSERREFIFNLGLI